MKKKELCEKISAIINQDGDIYTDGQVIDKIVDLLKIHGLYTERKIYEGPIKFLWKDKSGRGDTATVDFDNMDEDNEFDYDGTSLADYAMNAEIGDEWENSTDYYIRTK